MRDTWRRSIALWVMFFFTQHVAAVRLYNRTTLFMPSARLAQSMTLSPDGKFLYVANTASSASSTAVITVYDVFLDGNIGFSSEATVATSGHTINQNGLACGPTNLFLVTNSNNHVYRFPRNNITGALSSAVELDLPVGLVGPQSAKFVYGTGPDHNFLVVGFVQEGGVTVYNVSKHDGTVPSGAPVGHKGSVSSTTRGCGDIVVPVSRRYIYCVAGIAFEENQSFFYASEFDPRTGVLASWGTVEPSVTYDDAKVFSGQASPDGRFLYFYGSNSDFLFRFNTSVETGAIVANSEVIYTSSNPPGPNDASQFGGRTFVIPNDMKDIYLDRWSSLIGSGTHRRIVAKELDATTGVPNSTFVNVINYSPEVSFQAFTILNQLVSPNNRVYLYLRDRHTFGSDDGSVYSYFRDFETLPPVLHHPHSHSVQSRVINITFTLPEGANINSVKLVFKQGGTYSTYTVTGGATLNADGSDVEVLFQPRSPADSTANSLTVSPSTPLEDGVYELYVEYLDLSHNPKAESGVVTNITIDTITQPPVLYLPQPVQQKNPLTITYMLPEAANTQGTSAPNLLFTAVGSGTTNYSIQMTVPPAADNGVGTTGSNVSFLLNSKSPLAPAQLASVLVPEGGASEIVDGFYDVQVSYIDAPVGAASNPRAVSNKIRIQLDTVTNDFTLSLPANGASFNHLMSVQYTLTEDCSDGRIEFINAATHTAVVNFTINATRLSTGQHTFSLNVNAPLVSELGAIVAATDSGSIPEGSYNVRVRFTDLVNNPFAFKMATDISIDRTTIPPTLFPVKSNVGTDNVTQATGNFNVTFIVTEKPSLDPSGIIHCRGLKGSYNLSLADIVMPHIYSYSRSTVLVTPRNMKHPAGILFIKPALVNFVLPDDVYNITVSYVDALHNPRAYSPQSFLIYVDTITEPPVLSLPTSNLRTKAPLYVNYSLPEAPKHESATLSIVGTTVTGESKNILLQLYDGQVGNLLINPHKLETNSIITGLNGNTDIPDGVYNITVTYSDTASTIAPNAPASAEAIFVELDTVTLGMTLYSPWTFVGTTRFHALRSGFSLISPEDAPGLVVFQYEIAENASHVWAEFVGPSGSYQIYFKGIALGTGFKRIDVSPPNVHATATVDASRSAAVLPDGLYDMSFNYNDTLGNAKNTTHVPGVLIDRTTLQPTLHMPDYSLFGSAGIGVSYTLPEKAYLVQIVFQPSDGAKPIFVNLTKDSYATNTINTPVTFTIPPANPRASTEHGGIVETSDPIPDNNYTVSVRYLDWFLNPDKFGDKEGASDFAYHIVVDTLTVAPILREPLTDTFTNTMRVNYSLAEAPKPNTVELVFTKITPSGEPIVVNMTDAQQVDFEWRTQDKPSSLTFVRGTPPDLTRLTACQTLGTCAQQYSVVLRYRDLAGNPAQGAVVASPPNTNVRIDVVTNAPILTSPASSTGYKILSINYRLPERQLNDSVVMTFTSVAPSAPGTEMNVTFSNVFVDDVVSFTWDPKFDPVTTVPGITASSGPTLLPEGYYNVALRYQDVLGNPIAVSQISTAVHVDFNTLQPTLLLPAPGTRLTVPFRVNFSLPEQPSLLSTEFRLIFQPTTGCTDIQQACAIKILLAADSEFYQSPRLNFTELTASQYPRNFSILLTSLGSSGGRIPDGFYNIWIQYQDLVLNPATHHIANNIEIDTRTIVPTLTLPVSGDVVQCSTWLKSPLQFNYTLRETPAPLSTKLTFTRTLPSALTIEWIMKDVAANTPTYFTYDPSTDPTSSISTYVQSATMTSVPDGTYSVTLTYRDTLNNLLYRTPLPVDNPTAAPVATSVVIDTKTDAPTLTAPKPKTDNMISVAYVLPEELQPGSALLTLASTENTLNLPLTDSVKGGNVAFTIDTKKDVASTVAQVVSGGANGVPEGNFTVSVSYLDCLGNARKGTSQSNIIVDKHTVKPVLFSPADNSTTFTELVNIRFQLPEMPLSRSVKVSFGQFYTITFKDTPLEVNINWDPAIPPVTALAAECYSTDAIDCPLVALADGVYTVTLSYQDFVGNPVNSTIANNVTVDTRTAPPTLINPPTGSSYGQFVLFTYKIPEQPLSGSVKMTFSNYDSSVSTPVVLTLSDKYGPEPISFSWVAKNNPTTDSTSSAFVTAISGGVNGGLPNGRYHVSLQYQDAVGNTAIHTSSHDVFVHVDAPIAYRLTLTLDTVFASITDTNFFAASVISDLAFALDTTTMRFRTKSVSAVKTSGAAALFSVLGVHTSATVGTTLFTFDILPRTNDAQPTAQDLANRIETQAQQPLSKLRTQGNITSTLDTTAAIKSIGVCVNELQIVIACPSSESTSNDDDEKRMVIGIIAGIILLGVLIAACYVHRGPDRKISDKERMNTTQEAEMATMTLKNAKFEDMDVDGDGMISPEEFNNYIDTKLAAAHSQVQLMDNEAPPGEPVPGEGEGLEPSVDLNETGINPSSSKRFMADVPHDLDGASGEDYSD